MTSHEFRTPLTIIDGAAQRLQRQSGGMTKGYATEKACVIHSAVARMVDLMESFLSAGRIDHGRMTYEFRPCFLKEVIERCIVRQKSITSSHEFHLQLDDLPPGVIGDTTAMEQVFTNLISNDVKNAPLAPDIHVTGCIHNGCASVKITDHGVGIDEDDLPKMFQRYFRARSSTGIAGTGIGLHLVRQIMEAHSGTVTLESKKGEGTTFTVTMPLNIPVHTSPSEKTG